MDRQAEEKALKLYKQGTKKLFKENIDSAYIDLNRVLTLYPDTHIAMKSLFLIVMINKMELYTQCIMTETFSNGIKALEKNVILDMFNKNRLHFISQYDKYATKRQQAFVNLAKSLSTLLEKETYPVIYSFINFSARSLKECTALAKIDEIRDGTIYPEEDLTETINELRIYLLITIVSDDFDVEFTDQLSSIEKRKLDRVDFYHSCITWLNKFYEYQPHYKTGELIRKCCRIVISLTNDSANPKRQLAFETLSKMSKDYYTMAYHQDEIVEKEVQDIEDEFFISDEPRRRKTTQSLMQLASFDERVESCLESFTITSPAQLAFEVNLEPSQELLAAKEELTQLPEEEKTSDSIGNMLEFD